MALTDADCKKIATGADEWLTDGGARGAGKLYIRITKSGSRTFYFRYFDAEGKRDNYPLGEYDLKGRAGLRLPEARDRAGELSRLYLSGVKNIRQHLDRDAAEREQARRSAEQAERDAIETAKRGTLDKLLTAYESKLERDGKGALSDVRNIFKNHVREAFPDLVQKRAADIKTAELRPVLARLVDAGKGRTAGKARSYLRAAYAAAMRAENDPSAPEALLGFGIEINPADALATMPQFNVPGERHLSVSELRAYIKRVEALNSPAMRDALLAGLYLGGQRVEQLLRASLEDFNAEAQTITLYDSKGRRIHARRHVLPLPPMAEGVFVRLAEDAKKRDGDVRPLFTSNGRSPIVAETLSKTVGAIAKAMVEAEEATPFSLKDIRRTCETMLAGMQVSKDHRAQIQSHGLGGVQDRHYDKHDYLDEKRKVLVRWEARIKEIRDGKEASKVVQLTAA